jgi:arylformamidase
VTQFVELSHTLETGMPVYPGHPLVEFLPVDAEYPRQILQLQIGTHSGTHIDAARHFIPTGRTIDQYPLQRFIVPAVIVAVQASRDHEIEWEALADAAADVPEGGALLVETGWDRHWGDEAMRHHPYFGIEACENLVAAGVGLVGTDAVNVDCTSHRTTTAHETLLGHDVLIVENLTNLSLLAHGAIVECAFVPLMLAGADGSPVRAYARLD